VVAPVAVEAQVARREALVAKAVLLQHAARARVLGHHRGLHAMQPAGAEGEVERQGDGLGRVAPPARSLVDEVAERRVLPRAAHDVGQRDAPAHDAAVALDDREGVGAVGRPLLAIALDLRALARLGEEPVRPPRLPRPQEVAVAYAQRRELGDVAGGERA